MSATATPTETTTETLRLAVGAVTDAAGRADNQDVALAVPIGGDALAGESDSFLLAVADGMGGHPSGDVASRIAVDTLQDALVQLPAGDIGLALKQAYRRANEAIYQAGESDATHAGMGTTLTAAVLRGKYATVGNVGDSRAYLLRANNLTQVTRDHTLVADEVEQGRISAEAARHDSRKNILTHALGTHPKLDSKLPSIYELTLLPGDRLMLCSDGLYDVLDDDQMRRAMLGDDPEAAARELVELAKQRGTRDNATAVVATAIPTRVPVVSAQPSPAARTGGLPGFAIAAAVAILLLILLVLAVVVLGVSL